MNVLVTGATGFVGRFVARRLAATDNVRVFARGEESARRTVGTYFTVYTGDFRDAASLRRAMDGVEAVYHIGARRDHWGLPYSEYYESNVVGTRNLRHAAKTPVLRNRLLQHGWRIRLRLPLHANRRSPPVWEASELLPQEQDAGRGDRPLFGYADRHGSAGVDLWPGRRSGASPRCSPSWPRVACRL